MGTEVAPGVSEGGSPQCPLQPFPVSSKSFAPQLFCLSVASAPGAEGLQPALTVPRLREKQLLPHEQDAFCFCSQGKRPFRLFLLSLAQGWEHSAPGAGSSKVSAQCPPGDGRGWAIPGLPCKAGRWDPPRTPRPGDGAQQQRGSSLQRHGMGRKGVQGVPLTPNYQAASAQKRGGLWLLTPTQTRRCSNST